MRFEDEYKESAEFLMGYYAEKHAFMCPRGHTHRLPYFLHVGRDFCRHIPLKDCREQR